MRCPAWFQAYLDAPTSELPGFFGDWLDADVEIVEDEDSVTLSRRGGSDAPYVMEVRLFGDREKRRSRLVLWAFEDLVLMRLAKAIEDFPDLANRIGMCELPLRLTFSEDYVTKLLGIAWEEEPE